MCITRRYWLLLGILLGLSGCNPARAPVPDSPRPLGPIPTPPDAPAEPTFEPDVPPRLIRDIRPLSPQPRQGTVERRRLAAAPLGDRPTLEDEGSHGRPGGLNAWGTRVIEATLSDARSVRLR